MSSRRPALSVARAILAALTPVALAQVDKPTANTIEGDFDFIDCNGGTLMAEQVPADDYMKLLVLDLRDAGQFAKDHIPGAINIERRKVFAERGKLPKDKTILDCCNTAAKTFASCTAAMENGRRGAACSPTRD